MGRDDNLALGVRVENDLTCLAGEEKTKRFLVLRQRQVMRDYRKDVDRLRAQQPLALLPRVEDAPSVYRV